MFGSDVNVQVTIYNRPTHRDEGAGRLMQAAGDGYDEYREEMNSVILDKMREGKNNLRKEKYLTVSVPAKNAGEAELLFRRMDSDIDAAVKKINPSGTEPMGFGERLNMLYDIYNPGSEYPLMRSDYTGNGRKNSFSLKAMKSQGISTKDQIAPPLIRFEKDCFMLGDTYGQTLYLQGLQSYLSTDFMDEVNDVGCVMLTSVHFEPLRQDRAVKLIKNHIVNINSNVIEAQKRAARSGYSPDLISPDLLKSREDSDKILSDMTSRNQKLFYVTFVVTHFAESREKLRSQAESIKTVAQKSLVTLNTLMMQQEWGLEASVPVGRNRLSVKRLLTTEQASVFIPYSVQELNQDSGIYYGLNAVSRNLIMFDRLKSKNANGIILGTPGSGKSFSAKREMLSVLLGSSADVFVIDPEREYTPLANMFGGEVVRIAAGSKVYINPLDMDMAYADEDDPVTLKSDFICSLCETVLGGRYGLSESQKSVIDRCVREVYRPYVEYMGHHPECGSCDVSRMPTMTDLYNLLMEQPEPEACAVALSLERFVTGSLDVFAHRTNVKTDARFVVYDIKDIGSGLKEMGLQVCLNDIWNRTIANRHRNRRTWFYIDEFYLLTQTDSSAQFLQQIFKRARKWGGVPTGITQNVEDMLVSKEARTIIANCDFVMMLNQAPVDRAELQKMFGISSAQLSYITGAETGQGLLYTGKIVPFTDRYPENTMTFRAMSTRMEES